MDSSPLGFSVHGIFSGKNTGLGRHFLLQGIFQTQGLNPGLLCCRQSPALQADSLPTEPPGKPRKLVQFSSVTQLCLTLSDPMNHSTPGLPVHHQLLQSTQTHVHQVGDANQPPHPLSLPSPPAPNPFQHQGLFQWVNSAWGGQSIGVSASASVLPMNTQDWSPLG